jgi:hypothetical protein
MKASVIATACLLLVGFACSGIKEFFNPEPDQIKPGEIHLTLLPDSAYGGVATCGPVKVKLEVDVISGATISSKTILLAIEYALDTSCESPAY